MPHNTVPSQPCGAGSSRVSVRGPRQAPSADEALMGLGRGHLSAGGSLDHPDDGGLRRLRSAQLRLALAVGAAFFTVLAGAFLLLELSGPAAAWSVAGVPLSWAVPGLLLGPLTVLAGWWHLRASRRLEHEFLSGCARVHEHSGSGGGAEGSGR